MGRRVLGIELEDKVLRYSEEAIGGMCHRVQTAIERSSSPTAAVTI